MRGLVVLLAVAACKGGVGDDVGDRYHPRGWAAASMHGPATKLQTESDCRACHGADLTGATALGCDSCHPAGWRTDCTFCHGGEATDDGAPPRDIDDNTDPETISFTPHAAHVAGTYHPAYDCVQCHAKPTDVLTPGHLFDDDTPGRAEVAFSAGLSAAGTYDGDGGCSNLYCHGNGQGPNGNYVADYPRPACDDCHPFTGSSSADLLTMSSRHRDHILDSLASCHDCHGETVSQIDTLANPALHVDGEVQVLAAEGLDWDGTSCLGACHGHDHVREERW